jgi:hypothetical protein
VTQTLICSREFTFWPVAFLNRLGSGQTSVWLRFAGITTYASISPIQQPRPRPVVSGSRRQRRNLDKIEHVTLIDGTGGPSKPDMSIVVDGARIATLNGPAFLGRDRDMGTVSEGKIADLLALD